MTECVSQVKLLWRGRPARLHPSPPSSPPGYASLLLLNHHVHHIGECGKSPSACKRSTISRRKHKQNTLNKSEIQPPKTDATFLAVF